MVVGKGARIFRREKALAGYEMGALRIIRAGGGGDWPGGDGRFRLRVSTGMRFALAAPHQTAAGQITAIS